MLSFRIRRKMRWAAQQARRARTHGYDQIGWTYIGSQRVITFSRKDGSARGITSPEAVAYVIEHCPSADTNLT